MKCPQCSAMIEIGGEIDGHKWAACEACRVVFVSDAPAEQSKTPAE